MDAIIGALWLPQKGMDIVIQAIYYWSSCTRPGFTLGARVNPIKIKGSHRGIALVHT